MAAVVERKDHQLLLLQYHLGVVLVAVLPHLLLLLRVLHLLQSPMGARIILSLPLLRQATVLPHLLHLLRVPHLLLLLPLLRRRHRRHPDIKERRIRSTGEPTLPLQRNAMTTLDKPRLLHRLGQLMLHRRRRAVQLGTRRRRLRDRNPHQRRMRLCQVRDKPLSMEVLIKRQVACITKRRSSTMRSNITCQQRITKSRWMRSTLPS